MAAGFKTATVNASDVPSTQTNFPAYVDLSRLGITTLAEAQSVRVYADSEKTTEWAREIVSATEMHVKIPSLTSSTTIYVEYDGARSDYAVTDTYGRNAVWSDYASVFHQDMSSGNAVDSTGNLNVTQQGSPSYSQTGQIGDATDLPTTSDYFEISSGGAVPSPPITLQAWFNPDNAAAAQSIIYVGQSNSEVGLLTAASELWALSQSGGNAQAETTTTLSNNTWYMGHGVFTSISSRTVYLNGVAENTNTTSKNTNTGSGISLGGRFSTTAQQFVGLLDELRVRESVLSADWITTEYNNQNDEATFWGTWTDVGGGYRFVPQLRPFAGL